MSRGRESGVEMSLVASSGGSSIRVTPSDGGSTSSASASSSPMASVGLEGCPEWMLRRIRHTGLHETLFVEGGGNKMVVVQQKVLD
jgi:hypothetical protein